jgi:hypothetical protein
LFVNPLDSVEIPTAGPSDLRADRETPEQEAAELLDQHNPF